MELNPLQKEILTAANEHVGENIYPKNVPSELGNIDDIDFFRQFSAEVAYLERYELIEVIWSNELFRFRKPHSFSITPNGRDFLARKNRCIAAVMKRIGKEIWLLLSGILIIVIAAIVLYNLGYSK